MIQPIKQFADLSVSLSKLLQCNQEQPITKGKKRKAKPEENSLLEDALLSRLANDQESNDVDSDRRTEEDDYAEQQRHGSQLLVQPHTSSSLHSEEELKQVSSIDELMY